MRRRIRVEEGKNVMYRLLPFMDEVYYDPVKDVPADSEVNVFLIILIVIVVIAAIALIARAVMKKKGDR